MRKSTSNSSLVAQLTNEVQNGDSIARTYDSLNRPTGYTIMQNAECRMQNGGGNPSTLQPFNPSTVTYSYGTLGRFSGVGFNAEPQRIRVSILGGFRPRLRLRRFGRRFGGRSLPSIACPFRRLRTPPRPHRRRRPGGDARRLGRDERRHRPRFRRADAGDL